MTKYPKKNYHDFVIKNGQFIGKFEEMYQQCSDPWIQTTQPNKFARTAGIIQMKSINATKILECGCGLGYYSNAIFKELGIVPRSIDISPTGIARAKKLFPKLSFEVCDITKSLIEYKTYDCVLFAEIIWYILPDLDNLFEVLEKHFKGKHLVVVQVFYKGQQEYGNEYFTNLKEFIKFVPFECLSYSESTQYSDSTIETASLFKI